MDREETDYCQQVGDHIAAEQCAQLQGRPACRGCEASFRRCLGCGRSGPLKDARQGTCSTCHVARKPVMDDVQRVVTMLDHLEAALNGFPLSDSELPAIPEQALPPPSRHHQVVSVRIDKATQPGVAASTDEKDLVAAYTCLEAGAMKGAAGPVVRGPVMLIKARLNTNVATALVLIQKLAKRLWIEDLGQLRTVRLLGCSIAKASSDSLSPEEQAAVEEMHLLGAKRARLDALIAAKQGRLQDLRKTLAAWQVSVAQLRTLLETAET